LISFEDFIKERLESWMDILKYVEQPSIKGVEEFWIEHIEHLEVEDA
jgi:hypothetical protein